MALLLRVIFILFISLELFAADADKGKKVFNKCKACHTIEEGGKNKIGPNLWNIVDKQAGQNPSFKYSKAFLEFSKNGGKWDDATLKKWLSKPKSLIKKTKMIYPGLKKEKDIADIIAYLRANGS